jgi:hypothetical protein
MNLVVLVVNTSKLLNFNVHLCNHTSAAKHVGFINRIAKQMLQTYIVVNDHVNSIYFILLSFYDAIRSN